MNAPQQFRISKIEKIVEKLEFRLGVFEEMKVSNPNESGVYKGMLDGRIEELQKVIAELREEFKIPSEWKGREFK